MLIYFMRHGIAEENAANDFERALTDKGIERTRQAARGLACLCQSGIAIFSSPKIRARQTAQIVAQTLGAETVEIWESLENGPDWETLRDKLREIESDALFVGHEPHLSELASEILVGQPQILPLRFKKAGVCVVEWSPQTGEVALQAFLPPQTLRQLAAQTAPK